MQIAILFKALTSLAKTSKSTITSQVNTFNSSLLVYSFIMKTIPTFYVTKVQCGKQRKFELFVGYCFVVSQLDEIL